MKEKTSLKGFYEQYIMKKNIKILLIILCAFSFLFTIIASGVVYSIQSIAANAGIKWLIWNIIKDISAVIFSILGVNFLVTICLEKQSKNSMLDSFFKDDIISNSNFYDNMKKDQKAKMLSALEKSCYCHGTSDIDIHKSINTKLKDITSSEYYLNYCNYNITCYVTDSEIRKEITKTMVYGAFGKAETKDEFLIMRYSSDENPEDRPVEIKELSVNGKPVNLSTDIEYRVCHEEGRHDKKLSYSKVQKIYLKNSKFKFDDNDTAKLEMVYEAKQSSKDLATVFRLDKPCKKLELDFAVKNNDYQVKAFGFGFNADGRNTPNAPDKGRVKIEFDDWMFPCNGFAVFLEKK